MNSPIEQRVLDALKTIRPYLETDGGDVELVEVTQDRVVKVELKGACKSCSMNMMTMRAGIEETIRAAVPEIKAVVSVDKDYQTEISIGN